MTSTCCNTKKWFLLCALFVCIALTVSCESDTTGPPCSCGTTEPPLPPVYHGWQSMYSGTSNNLRAVWGFASGEVFAVGDNGTILYYDGDNWREMDSGTTADLRGVWGCSPQDVLVTGDGGTVLLGGVVGWLPQSSGTTEPIGSISGITTPGWCDWYEAYAVGGGPPGTITRFEKEYWGQLNIEPLDIGASDEFLDILTWPGDYDFEYCWAAIAVGRNGTAYSRYVDYYQDIDEWIETDTGTDEDLIAVFGESPNNVFAVTRSGIVIQNTKQYVAGGPSSKWREVARLYGNQLFDITARSYNDIFFVGAEGRIVNFDRRTRTEMRSPIPHALNAVWATEDRALAVGENGTVLQNTDPPRSPQCPVNVLVSVSEGTSPRIDWSPPCPVSKIFLQSKDGRVTWFIAADGNLIDPAITYGISPPGVVELCPAPVPLRAGELYHLTLVRRDRYNELTVGAWNVVPADENSTSPGNAATAKTSPAKGGDPSAQDNRGFYFPRLVRTSPEPLPGEPEDLLFYGVTRVLDGPWRWLGDPSYREEKLNIRQVRVLMPVRDPNTGEVYIFVTETLRAADLGPVSYTNTVVWDVMSQD